MQNNDQYAADVKQGTRNCPTTRLCSRLQQKSESNKSNELH